MRISDWSSDVCSSDLIITSMGFDTRHINNSPNSIMGRFMGLFTRHPASVGESYFQHMASSFSFAAAMLRGALAALVHGIFPFFFVKTGSGIITRLHQRMVTHRART